MAQNEGDDASISASIIPKIVFAKDFEVAGHDPVPFVVDDTEARLAAWAESNVTTVSLNVELDARSIADESIRAALSQKEEIALLREVVTLLLSEGLWRGNDANDETISELRLQLGEHLLTKAKCLALEKRLLASAEGDRRIRSLLGAQLLSDAQTARELLKASEALTGMTEERNCLRKDVEGLIAHLNAINKALIGAKEHLSTICTTLDSGAMDNAWLREELTKVSQWELWRPSEPPGNLQRELTLNTKNCSAIST
jgi:hypothetical protein